MADEQEFSDIPAFTDLERARESVQTAQTLLDDASQDVLQAIYTIAIQTEDNIPLRYAIIQHLYWAEDVNPTTLAEIFGVQRNELAKIAANFYEVDLYCNHCHQSKRVSIKSKTHLATLKRDQKLYVCEECRATRSQIIHEQYERQMQEQRERLEQLRTMPYREYLQTPEWQQRRAEHLKRARYRCQVCNAGNIQLNVHHRTYERRGNENIRDLIVLCRNCHEIFHQQGKLQD